MSSHGVPVDKCAICDNWLQRKRRYSRVCSKKCFRIWAAMFPNLAESREENDDD